MASEERKARGGEDETMRKMKGMERMVFAKFNGINYLQTVDDGHVEEKVRKMKEKARDFPIRDDDTIIVGYPRCGNHWTFEVVNMILRQEATYTPISFVDCVLEMFRPEAEKLLNDLESPRLLCQHSFLRDLPAEAIHKRNKIICLVREPRSALISLYKVFIEMKGDAIRFQGTWDDFFETIMAGECIWGNLIDYYKDIEDFQKNHPECPIYIRSFEKGVEDPVQQIQELCTFLGKPDHLALDIAKATSFDAMKTGTKEKFEVDRGRYFKKDSKGFLTGGKGNSWKNWFTYAQNERLSRYIDEKLSRNEVVSLIQK